MSLKEYKPEILWFFTVTILSVAAAVCVLLCGCAALPFSGDKSSTPLAVGKTQAGYGRMNAWATDENTLKKDIEACAKYGVHIYHAELFSWGGGVPNTDAKRKQIERCYATAIEACRKRGMYFFISAFNANLGSGKYGDPGIPLAKYPGEIAWALKTIKKHGPKNVLLQPMAETGGGYPAQLEAKIAKEFGAAGFTLVNNRGSRPKTKPSWAAWNAWHPWKITDKIPRDQIVVSDTGMIIQQLCHGLEGAGKPDTAGAWARRYKDAGNPAVVFYHFKYPSHDSATIKAMGEGVK